MLARGRAGVGFAAGFLLLGCASPAPVEARSAAETKEASAPPRSEDAAGSESGPPPGSSHTPEATPAAAVSEAPVPADVPGSTSATVTAVPAPAEATAPAAVEVENIGLHIGGGVNDAKSKAPFQEAIATQFDAFKDCYGQIDGGRTITVGVDLFVGKEGGAPEVRDIRSGVKKSHFTSCMTRAFQAVEFDRPSQGPTLFSYSLRFAPKP